MEGYPMEYELRFVVWNGIYSTIERAIKRKDVEAIETLREAVEFYNREFIISGKDLEDLLNELESLKGKE
ncbi:hypothetical protein [Tepidanaerobacter acetatoxydans]|uniref:hypothetical protein n=1 Tax=Tepidanaerobacter acetatoxydans TaxID=499229 RepID=UPI001BD31447|nr:hypothetical protein [Tepidanaerobacter acetatoxydans]